MSYNPRTVQQEYPNFQEWKNLLSSTYKSSHVLYVPFDYGIKSVEKTNKMSISYVAYLWASFFTGNKLTPSEEHNNAATGIPSTVIPIMGDTVDQQLMDWMYRSDMTMIPMHKIGLVSVGPSHMTSDHVIECWREWVSTINENRAQDYYDYTGVKRGTFSGHIDHVRDILQKRYGRIGSLLSQDLMNGNTVLAIPDMTDTPYPDSKFLMNKVYSDVLELYYKDVEPVYRDHVYNNAPSRLSALLRTLHSSVITVKRVSILTVTDPVDKVREVLKHENNVNAYINNLLSTLPDDFPDQRWRIITIKNVDGAPLPETNMIVPSDICVTDNNVVG